MKRRAAPEARRRREGSPRDLLRFVWAGEEGDEIITTRDKGSSERALETRSFYISRKVVV